LGFAQGPRPANHDLAPPLRFRRVEIKEILPPLLFSSLRRAAPSSTWTLLSEAFASRDMQAIPTTAKESYHETKLQLPAPSPRQTLPVCIHQRVPVHALQFHSNRISSRNNNSNSNSNSSHNTCEVRRPAISLSSCLSTMAFQASLRKADSHLRRPRLMWVWQGIPGVPCLHPEPAHHITRTGNSMARMNKTNNMEILNVRRRTAHEIDPASIECPPILIFL